MARMSIDIRRRLNCLHHQGFKLEDIQLWLEEEDISKRSFCLLIKKYELHGTMKLLDMPRPVQPGKLSLEHLKIFDSSLEQDDKTLVAELRGLLHEAGVRVSVSTIQCAKRKLG